MEVVGQLARGERTMPANIACASESWPASPVSSVIERKMIEYAAPMLRKNTHCDGTSTTTAAMESTRAGQRQRRTFRSITGGRIAIAAAGGGGSTPAIGSFVSSRCRNVGLTMSKSRSMKNGRLGTSAVYQTVSGGT